MSQRRSEPRTGRPGPCQARTPRRAARYSSAALRAARGFHGLDSAKTPKRGRRNAIPSPADIRVRQAPARRRPGACSRRWPCSGLRNHASRLLVTDKARQVLPRFRHSRETFSDIELTEDGEIWGVIAGVVRRYDLA